MKKKNKTAKQSLQLKHSRRRVTRDMQMIHTPHCHNNQTV